MVKVAMTYRFPDPGDMPRIGGSGMPPGSVEDIR